MSDPFIAEIRIFGGNYAPRGWARCEGQILPIAQNTALFSLIGTIYGGNGQTTFALPDLRGRAPMQFGQGPGLSDRVLGEQDGAENVTLLSTQMAAHSHSPMGSPAVGSQGAAAGGTWASSASGRTPTPLYQNVKDTAMRSDLVSFAGGNLPHNNMQPYLAITFIIALEGVYPPSS